MDHELKKISTISELQEEKARLLQEIRISKIEFGRSWDATQSNAKNLLLKGVVLPAGLVGLAIAGVRVVQSLRSGNDKEEENGMYEQQQYLQYNNNPPGIAEVVTAKLQSSSKWYFRLLPILFQLVRSYLATRQNHYNYQQEDVAGIENYPAESLESQRQLG